MSKSFADTLKQIRTEQGLSQQQLADKLVESGVFQKVN